MSITNSNVQLITNVIAGIADYSDLVFNPEIKVLLNITTTATRIILPTSQPVYTEISIQNVGGALTIQIGTDTFTITTANEMTLYYYGLQPGSSGLATYKVFFSAAVVPVSVVFTSTFVTIDPITFMPSFSPIISGLIADPLQTQSAGVVYLVSDKPIKNIFATAAAGNSALINIGEAIDQEHLTIYSQDVITQTNVVNNFWLLIVYN